MIPAWLSLLDAVLAVMFVAFGIAAAHFELIPPLFGFQMFVLGTLLATLGFFVGLIGIFRTRDPALGTGRRAAWSGVLVSLAIVLPTAALVVQSRGFPLLNDVTTDFADPPAFMHAGLLQENQHRDLGYDRTRCELIQKASYGSIAPLSTPESPAVAFQHVKVAAAEMPEWRVIYVDPQRFALEGIAASGLFRFRDDFVIEVRPGAGGSSLIEMRSKSRDGISDFGANASRIRAFFAILAKPPSPPAPKLS